MAPASGCAQSMGESERWTTSHARFIQVATPLVSVYGRSWMVAWRGSARGVAGSDADAALEGLGATTGDADALGEGLGVGGEDPSTAVGVACLEQPVQAATTASTGMTSPRPRMTG